MDITVGMKGEAVTQVEKEDTAQEVGSGELLVYATPCMAALMEGAACNAIAACIRGHRTEYCPHQRNSCRPGGPGQCRSHCRRGEENHLLPACHRRGW